MNLKSDLELPEILAIVAADDSCVSFPLSLFLLPANTFTNIRRSQWFIVKISEANSSN